MTHLDLLFPRIELANPMQLVGQIECTRVGNSAQCPSQS